MSQSMAVAVVPPKIPITLTAAKFISSMTAIIGAPNGVCQALPKLFLVRLAEMNWSQRIKQMREARWAERPADFSPAAFAKKVGVSGATVSDWESGIIKQISGPNLVKVASVLGVTPEWIISGHGSPDGRPQPQEAISDEQRSLWALWSDLFDQQRTEYLDRLHKDVQKNHELVKEIERKRFVVADRRVHKVSFNHPDWRKKDSGNG